MFIVTTHCKQVESLKIMDTLQSGVMNAFNSTTYPIDIEAEKKKFEKDINVIRDIIENLLPYETQDENEEAENEWEEEDETAGYATWKQQPADA